MFGKETSMHFVRLCQIYLLRDLHLKPYYLHSVRIDNLVRVHCGIRDTDTRGILRPLLKFLELCSSNYMLTLWKQVFSGPDLSQELIFKNSICVISPPIFEIVYQNIQNVTESNLICLIAFCEF